MNVGDKFGRLTVIGQDGKIGLDSAFLCRCDCGVELRVRYSCLRSGNTKSCGCLQRDRTSEARKTHGMTSSKEYWVWASMKQRCRDPKFIGYANYGGRGITVCGRWNDFSAFFADMGPRPSPGHSLDRIDSNGNYEPGNCRWATRAEQSLNRRSNRMLTFNGETKPLKLWAQQFEMPRHRIEARLRLGWSVADALTTPRRGSVAA